MVAAKTFNTSLPADPESDERQAEDDPPSASRSEVMEVSSQSGSGEMDVDNSEDCVSATLDEDLATAVQLYDKLVSAAVS